MSVVYKLHHTTEPHVFVGSTTNLKRRMIEHKYNCQNVLSEKYNYSLPSCIRNNGGLDKFKVEVLEEVKAREQVKLRLDFWMNELKPDLNKFLNLSQTKLNIKRREEKTTCPHCNNEYHKSNMRRHMRRKHKDYDL